MSWNYYLSLSENWSFSWALFLLALFTVYFFRYWPPFRRGMLVLSGLVLFYIVTGSPVAHLLDFGMHSVAMMQHVVILMLVPLVLWTSLPRNLSTTVNSAFIIRNKKAFVLFTWFAGTATMWIAHFINAAKISAETGLAICGISASANSWVTGIPQWLIIGLLFTAGVVFLWPVFGRDQRLKLQPLSSVIYLFTACVSCSILGLYVAFSASSAAPIMLHPESPWPMSLQADQELAGLLMWVPGCVLYVLTSVQIALNWLDGEQDASLVKTKLTSAPSINLNEPKSELMTVLYHKMNQNENKRSFTPERPSTIDHCPTTNNQQPRNHGK